MPDLVKELADLGRSLPPVERVRLLDLLLESLYEPSVIGADPAWSVEIERRVGVYERGEAVLYDADEVMVEAARIAP